MKIYRAKRKQDLSICTFLWGDWYGLRSYYLLKLKISVENNLDQPFRFVCFVDEKNYTQKFKFPTDIEFVYYTPKYRRNLNKLFMFSPDSGLTGRVVCFDLDILIVGDLSDIVGHRGDFVVCESLRKKGECGGSVISFQAGYGINMWKTLVNDPQGIGNRYKGSERKLYREMIRSPEYWQRLFPDQVVHYRQECKKGIPRGARLIFFTGYPKPHQVKSGWVRGMW